MITVLGGTGFVGSQIVKDLKASNANFIAPLRNEILHSKNLGDVIYCIGLTADFREKPHDTITAHVSYLNDLIKNNQFKSLTYCSSTRLYIHNTQTSENSKISIDITDPFDLYNSSKLTGELLALNCGRKNIKIARLSNVFGLDFYSNNFITSITKDAILNNSVELRTTPNSAKDYISVKDVSEMLIKLSSLEKTGIYNIAYGSNFNNQSILNKLSELTGCKICYAKNAQTIIFSEIENAKIINELNYVPKTNLITELETFVHSFKLHLNK